MAEQHSLPTRHPRSNRTPWEIIVACEAAFAVLCLLLRMYLANENKRRDLERPDEKYDNIYILGSGAGGQGQVDKVRFFSLPLFTGL